MTAGSGEEAVWPHRIPGVQVGRLVEHLLLRVAYLVITENENRLA